MREEVMIGLKIRMSVDENGSHKYRVVVCPASQESLVLVDAWGDVHGSEVIRLVERAVVAPATDRCVWFAFHFTLVAVR